MKKALRAAALAGFTILAAHVAAQGTPQTPAPAPAAGAQQTPAPPAGGRGQGRGRGLATFPAQQRPPGDPAVIERGKGLYTDQLHGVPRRRPSRRRDRRAQPAPIAGRAERSDGRTDSADRARLPRRERDAPAAVARRPTFRRSRSTSTASSPTARGQGAPPESDTPLPDALVGNAGAGETYFKAKCSSCHSAAGDLKGSARNCSRPRCCRTTG